MKNCNTAACWKLVIGMQQNVIEKGSRLPVPALSKSKCLYVCGQMDWTYPAPLQLGDCDLPWVEHATHLGHELHQAEDEGIVQHGGLSLLHLRTVQHHKTLSNLDTGIFFLKLSCVSLSFTSTFPRSTGDVLSMWFHKTTSERFVYSRGLETLFHRKFNMVMMLTEIVIINEK